MKKLEFNELKLLNELKLALMVNHDVSIHELDKLENIVKDKNEPPRDCWRLNILREYDNEKTNLHS